MWDWWWNIRNNTFFNFRLFPRKTNDIFQQIYKTLFRAILGPFCPNLGKNKIHWKKGLSVYNCSNYVPSCQKSEKLMSHTWEKSWTDVWTDWQIDNSDFIGPSVGQGSNYQSNFKFSWIYTSTLKTSLFHWFLCKIQPQFLSPGARVSTPIYDHAHPNTFNSTFNCNEFVSTCKKSGFFIMLF